MIGHVIRGSRHISPDEFIRGGSHQPRRGAISSGRTAKTIQAVLIPELIPFIASAPLRSPLHRLLRLEQGSAGARQSRCGAEQDTLKVLA